MPLQKILQARVDFCIHTEAAGAASSCAEPEKPWPELNQARLHAVPDTRPANNGFDANIHDCPASWHLRDFSFDYLCMEALGI